MISEFIDSVFNEYLQSFDRLIIFFLLLLLLYLTYIYIRNKKRTNELANIAMMKGFSFSKKMKIDEFSSFYLFNRRSFRRIRNVIKGRKNNRDFIVMDYKGGLEHGNNSVRGSVACITLNNNLPQFIIFRKGVNYLFPKIFSSQIITFEKFPEFSKRFLVRVKNEEEIRKTLNKYVLAWFEKTNDYIDIECLENKLCYWNAVSFYNPKNFDEFLDKAIEIADLFENKSLKKVQNSSYKQDTRQSPQKMLDRIKITIAVCIPAIFLIFFYVDRKVAVFLLIGVVIGLKVSIDSYKELKNQMKF